MISPKLSLLQNLRWLAPMSLTFLQWEGWTQSLTPAMTTKFRWDKHLIRKDLEPSMWVPITINCNHLGNKNLHFWGNLNCLCIQYQKMCFKSMQCQTLLNLTSHGLVCRVATRMMQQYIYNLMRQDSVILLSKITYIEYNLGNMSRYRGYGSYIFAFSCANSKKEVCKMRASFCSIDLT